MSYNPENSPLVRSLANATVAIIISCVAALVLSFTGGTIYAICLFLNWLGS